MADQAEKIVYPPGCRELTPDISTDDFVRRLKECAQAFQVMVQEEDNTAYIPLALHLASDLFLEHRSQDVRLIAACCLADIFRIYAPDAPFTDLSHVKVIFEFFVEQLKGLKNPNSPSFKRYFYLLQNFACVRTFNLCVELDNCKEIFLKLFKLMFQIVGEINNHKVEKTVLDMLAALISESDVIHREILDVIFIQIIEPNKTQNTRACLLAQDLIRRSLQALKPYIQSYFENALYMPRSNQSILSRHLFDLIYELFTISFPLTTVIIPQLGYKLKSSSLDERLQVVRVVARMFADKHSKLINQDPALWSGYLSRFNDIDPMVRILCSEYSKPMLLNHPESKDDLTEQLKPRCRDLNDEVRYTAVMAILGAAKEFFSSINDDLLNCIKERTLDKKFRIRKEALLGLARLYKQHSGINSSTELLPEEIESISWIKNKILHVYYQNSVNDRLLVERILYSCLVPYNKPMEDRMKMLYKLFCTIDDNAIRAFTEILKSQKNLRTQMEQVLDLIQHPETPERQNVINQRISQLTKHFQDPAKCSQLFLKFFNNLRNNPKVKTMLSVTLQGNISSSEAENKVKTILSTLGAPNQTNHYYFAIKQLLESTVPMMLDKEGVKHLVNLVKDSLLGDGKIESELKLTNSYLQGLQLLLVLSCTLPLPFQSEQIYQNLMDFLKVKDDKASDLTLQILSNISKNLEASFPEITSELVPLLENFIKTGNAKQAKHAVYCLHTIVSDREKVFGNLVKMLKNELTINSQYCRTALESIGHIAFLCHDMFAPDFKHIVSDQIVKRLLMLEEKDPDFGDVLWGPFESLSDIIKVKIAGMKVMIRWLRGLKDMVQPTLSTIGLFSMMINRNGDLMEKKATGPIGLSWMRLSAALSILKLCHEPRYAEAVRLEDFQSVASIMNDPCLEVKQHFIQKLYKGLAQLQLPLEFMAIMSLSALDSDKSFKEQVKKYLINSIGKRRVHVKEKNLSKDELPYYLPDYALQYAVHLLAHQKFFKDNNDSPSLLKIVECLNLLLDALMFKNEDYNYAFYKRLLENIKQTKDGQCPDDEVANTKMYAVCDLAWSIILSKSNIVLKEFPAEPILNSKFFTNFDKSYSNMKMYLPPDVVKKFRVKPGFNMVPPADSTLNNTTVDSSVQSKGTKSNGKSKSKSNQVPAADNSTVLRESAESKLFDQTVLEEAPSNSRDSEMADNLDSTALEMQVCDESPVVNKDSCAVPRSSKRGGHRKPPAMNGGESSRRTRSSNPLQSPDSPASSTRPIVEKMKNCLVQVQRMPQEEVERYTSPNSSGEPQDPSGPFPPNSPPSTDEENSSPKRNTRSRARNTSPPPTAKRKREGSQSTRSVRSRTSPVNESTSSSSKSSSTSSPQNGEANEESSLVSPNFNHASEILHEVNTVTRGRKKHLITDHFKENNSALSMSSNDSLSTSLSSNSTKAGKRGKSIPQPKNGLNRSPITPKTAKKSPAKSDDVGDGKRLTRTMKSKQEQETQRTTRQNLKNKQKADSKRR